jgi:Major Facilitator Superfamily
MGVAGQYFAKSAIFFGAAALCIPALIALSRIRADEIDYARARNAGKGEQAKSYHRIFDLGKNRNLYIFAACVFLFQFADASLLPLVGQNLAQSDAKYESLFMAGLIVVPQIVVALLSPWIGYYSDKWGRKPLLLLGFGLEIIRTVLFAFSANVSVLLTASITRRHQRCGRHRTHNPGGQRSDHRYRPIQLSTRVHRHPDRHRRFDQHHRNRLSFRSTRQLAGVSDPGGSFRYCNGRRSGRQCRRQGPANISTD